ncbi:MAG TPA: efflux RND transporter periplasmic adaptor subunit [Gemmatales bacterium]|nr:efflux RND transporter periplasmic adaptor subunit [Gemmatales bacterium]
MKSIVKVLGSSIKSLAVICMVVLLLVGSIAGGWMLLRSTARAESPATSNKTVKVETLKRLGLNRFTLPQGYAERVGLQLGEIKRSDQPFQLPPLQGTLALDADQQVRIHSRFAGEIVSLGTTKVKLNTSPGETDRFETRPLRYLDQVKKGDLLAVVWSKDLGEKKSELIEACSKLKTDEETLNRLKTLGQEGASSERSIRDAQRTYDADRIALERAERTLRSWRLTDEEIKEVRQEAVLNKNGTRTENQQNWARVEVRAPQDGVILEKNFSVGDIIDTNFDLFKLGHLKQLKVWAHAYEEDLPLLESLPKPYRCEICLPAQSGANCTGEIQQIGAVVDPNQHTVLVMGTVNNDQGHLRIGQFVTVKLSLPPRHDELLLPAEALVEDGKESVIFLKKADNDYERRAVHVLRRTRENVVLRNSTDGLQPGQQIVTRGALLLREALEEQKNDEPVEKNAPKS